MNTSKASTTPNEKSTIADIAFETGLRYYRKENYEQAIKSYNHALEIYKQNEPLEEQSIAISV